VAEIASSRCALLAMTELSLVRDPILRHCEPTGPREARPDDRLREAISATHAAAISEPAPPVRVEKFLIASGLYAKPHNVESSHWTSPHSEPDAAWSRRRTLLGARWSTPSISGGYGALSPTAMRSECGATRSLILSQLLNCHSQRYPIVLGLQTMNHCQGA